MTAFLSLGTVIGGWDESTVVASHCTGEGKGKLREGNKGGNGHCSPKLRKIATDTQSRYV